jgi:hypothetical protein
VNVTGWDMVTVVKSSTSLESPSKRMAEATRAARLMIVMIRGSVERESIQA